MNTTSAGRGTSPRTNLNLGITGRGAKQILDLQSAGLREKKKGAGQDYIKSKNL